MPQFKVTASSLNVRQSPSLQGVIIGALAENDIVEQLDTSEDQKWLKVQRGDLVGWSSQKYLTPYTPNVPTGSLDQIIQIANSSAIATYYWNERGYAPRGYIKGMALVFARVYCKLLGDNPYAVEMAKADTGDSSRDALSYYANQFDQLGMDNDASGVVTLRHLFVLLLGLGMRESSGRWCEGRDLSANNTTSETAEAGLFQTSWNARSANSLLPQLFNDYRANPAGFLDVFKEGVTVKPQNLQNFGSGDGEEFQRLSKECPAFAAEFAAIGLRNIRKHWGPIIRHEAELRPEADRMFLRVQHAVDSLNLCPAVL
ncbi:MAG: SH3 domain-containing protein [Candidatus Competibacteraceae bacterium]